MSGEAQALIPAQQAPAPQRGLAASGTIASESSSSSSLFFSRDKTTPQAWEGTSEPPSPLPLPSPSSRKGAPENPPGGLEEAEEEQPGTGRQG